jgi:flagellar hook protein FlgE
MGYQQGLSGLSAAENDLDVIGNNIANADTVGFKSGTAVFADMYANSVATSVNNQIGIGTQLAEVQQQFSQGTIDTTGQALDVAINGNGFFQMSDNGSLTYSRNGVFQLNSTGQIVNAEGLQLMGYAANAAGVINTAQTVPLTVPTANIAPAATTSIAAQLNLNSEDPLMLGTPGVALTTGTGSTLASSGATITTASAGSNADTYTINFTSPTAYTVTDTDNPANDSSGTYTAGTAITLGNGETVTLKGTPVSGDSVTVTPTPTTFDANSSSTYNYSTSVQAYDSLGGSQSVNMYFAKTASNTWDVYAGVAGGAAQIVGQAQFSAAGAMTSFQQATTTGTPPTTTFAAPTTPGTVNFQIPNTDGSGTPQTLSLNLTGTTQFGLPDGVNDLSQNGYGAGQLSSFTVGPTGVLTGNYSNGQTASLGQIVLANFNDPNGLVDLGNNEYEATAESGAAQISAPGSTNHGTLDGGAVEESNTDLTNELVNLITAQRNYQANAQTIKTQQTVDQTLINM